MLALTGCQDLGPGDGVYGKVKLMAFADNAGHPTEVVSARIQINAIHIRSADTDEFLRFPIDPYELDLANPADGLENVLARGRVVPGSYDHVRLITGNRGTVTFDNGKERDLVVPSGSQTGLKLFVDEPVPVEADRLTVAAVSFDISRSFVYPGHEQTVIFKPVIRLYVTEPIRVEDVVGSGDSSSDGSEDGSGEDENGGSSGDDGAMDDDDLIDESDADDPSYPVIGI